MCSMQIGVVLFKILAYLWYFHVKFWSIWMPRNCIAFSGWSFPIRIKLMPFNIIAVFCGRFGILIDGLNNAYLVFCTFRDNLFTQIQSFNLTSSLFIVLYRTTRYTCDIYKVHCVISKGKYGYISAICNVIYVHKEENWSQIGTPQITFNIRDRIWLNSVYWYRSEITVDPIIWVCLGFSKN